jgi:hypothetical protein
MTSGPPYHEDLPRIAAEGFQLADRLCRGCGQLHALWPYIRLARATSAGLEDASSQLQAVLSGLFAAGRRHVLVAGAADTGLLALVARAGAGHPLDIVVLDRCETPLELCRRLAQRWSLPITTWHEDLDGSIGPECSTSCWCTARCISLLPTVASKSSPACVARFAPTGAWCFASMPAAASKAT